MPAAPILCNKVNVLVAPIVYNHPKTPAAAIEDNHSNTPAPRIVDNHLDIQVTPTPNLCPKGSIKIMRYQMHMVLMRIW